jgi:hypothetical protein
VRELQHRPDRRRLHLSAQEVDQVKSALIVVAMVLFLLWGGGDRDEPPVVEYTTTAPCEAPC